MSAGWTLVNKYTYNVTIGTLSVSNNNFFKIQFGKYSNDVRGIFSFYTGNPLTYIGYFNSNSYMNMIMTNSNTPYFPNIFDVYNDKTNLAILLPTNNTGYMINNNGTSTPYSAVPFSTSYNLILVNKNTSVGCLLLGSLTNQILTWDGSTSNVLASLNSSNYSVTIKKSRQSYNSDTLIYYYNTSVSNGTNLQMLLTKNPGSPLLATPFALDKSNPPILIESDGSSRIYMIYNNSFYRYNSGGKQFSKEYSYGSLLLDSAGGNYGATFIGDNLILLSTSTNNQFVKVFTYNTTTRNFSEKTLTVNNPAAIQGADIYYDQDNYRAYVGLIELKDVSNFMIYLYANQM